MATNNFLNNPAPNYQSFVDNQVLTDDQLNNMLDHLNYQDQLSRVLLSGVGIVCGLETAFDKANKIISLTQGAAVTTAGNLMKLAPQDFKAFKPFDDSYVKYAPFGADGDSTIPLWELELDSDPSDVEPLESFSAFDLEDAVGILYLEDYLEEDEDCSPVNCNTQGQDVVNKIRVLITDKANIEQINTDDSIITSFGKSQDSLDEYLPRHYAKRVVLNAVNTADYKSFLEAYETSFETIGEQLKKLASMALFKKIYNDSGLNIEQRLQKAEKYIYRRQYVYDFYKDIAECYNALRQKLLDEYAICCPDPEAFPKHVLLGAVSGSDPVWRHSFYPSPIVNRSNSLGAMKNAFRRLLYLIEQFEPEIQNEIVITPSRDENAALRARAIPYYYNLEDIDRSKDFIDQWKQNGAEWVPNYFSAGYPNTEDFEPLDIHLSGHDFYRIEGHLGQNVKDVHKAIKDNQRDHGLAFDVIPVAIGNYADENTINYTKYRAYFEDLQVVLTAWNKEQDCVTESVISFLSKFSTENIGVHKDYPEEDTAENEAENSDVTIIDTTKESEVESAKKYEGRHANYRKIKKELEVLEEKSKYSRVVKSGSEESEKTYPLSMMKMETGTPISGYQSVEMAESMVEIANYVDTTSGYMGENWQPIFEAGYAGSHIIVDLWDRIDVVLSNVDPDIRKLAGTAPAKMVGLLTDVQQSRLENIAQFNSDDLAAYIAAMDALCKEAKSVKKYLEEKSRDPNSEVSSKKWVEAYFYMLNRILSNCCITQKVKVLYEKVMERKRELLSQFVLHQFIQKHPGAEHKAGVAKGGTFVLLYLSQLRSFKRGDWSESSAATSYTEGKANIPHGTVVGDLCLPYICCSDTPSTTFVYPETPASLRLPINHVCMPEDGETDNIPLTVRPAEGTVKAYVGQRELSGVIVMENGETHFNPNVVDKNDYGKMIRFTVNDQVVEPMLALYEKPRPAFSFSFSEDDFNEEKTAVVVTFENNSIPFNKLSFEWDFGDGVQQNNALKFNHEFKVQPDANFDFPVTLTASNGPCEDSFTDSVNIEVSPLEEEEPIEDDDDPDEPPTDDNPDETDEEQQECFDNITKKLKAAMNLMQAELRENPDLLEGFSMQYKRTIQPTYQKIIDSPDNVLGNNPNTALLKSYYTFIKDQQIAIQTNIKELQTDVEREYALKLYYELLLLYFYLQACRDGKIEVGETISEVAENWTIFTDVAAGKYTKALGMLLDVDNIHQKLSELNDKMGDRFNNGVKEKVEELIQKLKNFLAEQ